jgi:hypothetical protein
VIKSKPEKRISLLLLSQTTSIASPTMAMTICGMWLIDHRVVQCEG